MASSVDAHLSNRETELKRKALLEEEIAEYKTALNEMFSTPNGKLVASKIIKYSGIHAFDNERIDGAKLIEKEARRKLWLELFRPYLNPTIRRELENP